MIPDYWKEFLEANDLIEKDFELSESEDLSGVGADFSLMSFEDIIDEAENYYPGIKVKEDGFIPVGSCQIGTGDPYFINKKEGKNGALYRIYHDSVTDEGYDHESAIDKVLDHYETLLNQRSNQSGDGQ
ncbi:hypothetical protein SH580_18425 [Coraliomargarita algicola]|uniref:Knr4/Smi1-like domain-containing protein n=1 Tax=Coraliomargarita algicola TaxID=3092156 RepID=A0ABZ0RGU6_9BACT|nr:hypothetical protein [Coraliomargarita sp. J2-16]WPJ95399.1 hypothetical protein SH580_18425 [Coraliomargarita sp. J2-16]